MMILLKMTLMLATLLHTYSFISQSMFTKNSMSRSMSMMARKKKEMPANPVVVVTGGSRGIGRAIV